MSTLSDGSTVGPPSTVNGAVSSDVESTSAVEPVIMRPSKRLLVPASVVEVRRGSLQMDILRGAGRRDLVTAGGLRGLTVPSTGGGASTSAVCADMPTIVGLKPIASSLQKPTSLLAGGSSSRRSSCYQSVLHTSGPFATSTIPLTAPPSAQQRRSSISGYPVVGAQRSGGLLAVAGVGGRRLGARSPPIDNGTILSARGEPAVEGRLDEEDFRRPTTPPQQRISRLPTIESESPVVANKRHSDDRSITSDVDETTMTSTSVIFDVNQTPPTPPLQAAAADDLDSENTDAGPAIVVSPPPPPPSPTGPPPEIPGGFPVADDVICNGIEPTLAGNRMQFKQPTIDDEECKTEADLDETGGELAPTGCRVSSGDLMTSSEEGVTTNGVKDDVTKDVFRDADIEQQTSPSLSATTVQPTPDSTSGLFNIDAESVMETNAVDEDSEDTPPEIPAFNIDVRASRRLDSEAFEEPAVPELNTSQAAETKGCSSPFSEAQRSDDIEERSSEAETAECHPVQLGINGSLDRDCHGSASTKGTSWNPDANDTCSSRSKVRCCQNGGETTKTGGINVDGESKENVDNKASGGVNGENDETNSARVKSINQVKDDHDSSGSLGTGVEKANGKEGPGRDVDGLLEVVINKGNLGLGFCISGGRGSAAGHLPIVVKRIFKGETPVHGCLVQGDEILAANGLDFTTMSHHEAWNTLKSLPDGAVNLVVRRK